MLNAPDIDKLRKSLDARPGDLRARRQLGDACRSAGRVDEAVEQYHALVGGFAAQGLLFKAIAACKLVLELRPDDDSASHMLAELYARRTAGKESAELPRAMSAALVVDDADVTDVEAVPPPIPEDDEEVIDVTALAAALTPLPEGAMRLERPPAVPLFSGLSPEAFEKLVRKLKAWEAEPNAVIVGEGEESDGVFVVVRGRVRVERMPGIVLARLGRDSFFGEMALLSRRPRAASVIAEEKTELLEIGRAVFEELVDEDPNVAVALDAFNRARLLDNLARTSPLLADLPVAAVKAALATFDSKRATPGTALVTEGAPAGGLFAVLSGELDVTAAQEIGTVRVKRLGPGDVFGEMSMLSGANASASVVAATDVALLVLPREAFAVLMSAHPSIEERLAALASSRRAFNARFLVPDETSSAVLV